METGISGEAARTVAEELGRRRERWLDDGGDGCQPRS